MSGGQRAKRSPHQPQGVSPRFPTVTSNPQREPDANAFRLISVPTDVGQCRNDTDQQNTTTMTTSIPPLVRDGELAYCKSDAPVPPGTFDNSPPFQRWDTRCISTTSPDRDERDSERDTTTMIDQLAIHIKCLSPLRGFAVGWALHPTDESVGYCRVSLRDKRKTGVEP